MIIFNIISKENIDGFVIQPTYGISEPSLDLLLNLYDVVFPYYIDVKVVPTITQIYRGSINLARASKSDYVQILEKMGKNTKWMKNA